MSSSFTQTLTVLTGATPACFPRSICSATPAKGALRVAGSGDSHRGGESVAVQTVVGHGGSSLRLPRQTAADRHQLHPEVTAEAAHAQHT